MPSIHFTVQEDVEQYIEDQLRVVREVFPHAIPNRSALINLLLRRGIEAMRQADIIAAFKPEINGCNDASRA